MGQVLRINFENKDHTFRILNEKPITRETNVLSLSLDGQSLKVIKTGKEWIAETPVEGISADLINAVVKNIMLRFRI